MLALQHWVLFVRQRRASELVLPMSSNVTILLLGYVLLPSRIYTPTVHCSNIKNVLFAQSACLLEKELLQ